MIEPTTTPLTSFIDVGGGRRLRVLAMTFNMNRKEQIFQMNQIFSEPGIYDIILIGG
jgi:hypothetical protein